MISLLYGLVFFLPLIAWALIIFALILPSTRKMLRSLVVSKNTISWQAFIFAFMFYISISIGTFFYGLYIQRTREPAIFEGLAPFMLWYIPCFAVAAFLLYLLNSYLMRRQYWGILGVVYGLICAFLVFFFEFFY